MDPAACDFKITAFFCKLMVDLVSIRDHSAGESIQEFPRMVRTAGRLPVKKHNGMGPAQWPVSVDPHVSLLAIFDLCMIDPHNFYRWLICMYDLTVIDPFMEPVIDQGQIYISTFDHPVCHGICGKLDTICFKSLWLSFQRQGICILAIDDGSDKCRGSDTVTEKILWPWSFQDSPVITFGGIYMDIGDVWKWFLRLVVK